MTSLEKFIYAEVREVLDDIIKTKRRIEMMEEDLERTKKQLEAKETILEEACDRFGFQLIELPIAKGGPYRLLPNKDIDEQ